MAATVTAPWVEWLTPMVQPMKPALGFAVEVGDALDPGDGKARDLGYVGGV